MKDVMGLIFTGENDIHLGELTSLRAVAALPIAGRYRVVDFQLSSMVHSGIKNVGVITQKNYSSLMDHIGSGQRVGSARQAGSCDAAAVPDPREHGRLFRSAGRAQIQHAPICASPVRNTLC